MAERRATWADGMGSPFFPLPWRGRVGEHRAKRDARRGGVTVSAPDTARKERLSPHPAARFTRVDPPPPGEGEIECAGLKQSIISLHRYGASSSMDFASSRSQRSPL